MRRHTTAERIVRANGVDLCTEVGAIVEHTTDAEQNSRRKEHRPCW